ncbi:hypothetical protein EVAR_42503_1 [Eumeta japonica]|uniref:C2H2-type domain-containing protein n=1 Tax=Eumeta variegata TaxID=151549 RepID=A0A4C1XE85_EUMVA|nr:hypothetical protein EVAR_42503_1 [Eumeta japonica]
MRPSSAASASDRVHDIEIPLNDVDFYLNVHPDFGLDSDILETIRHSKWPKVKLPMECPFHPARDIFAPQHAAKLQHRPSQWTCAFCGKSFYEERYLDQHFDTRHRNQINKVYTSSTLV